MEAAYLDCIHPVFEWILHLASLEKDDHNRDTLGFIEVPSQMEVQAGQHALHSCRRDRNSSCPVHKARSHRTRATMTTAQFKGRGSEALKSFSVFSPRKPKQLVNDLFELTELTNVLSSESSHTISNLFINKHVQPDFVIT